MFHWIDILKFANNGNPTPNKRVEKSDDEWKQLLTPEEYRITRQKGTERAHSSEMCNFFEPGKYACLCCGTELFDSEEKYQSGTGWPSFTQPIEKNAIAYHKDKGLGMYRIETVCNTCDAHLGHVFQDGPEPSGLRYCINALALGCFWCTEAIFKELKGVLNVESGYGGGDTKNPTYKEVISGYTNHAEVIQVTYDKDIIAYEELLKIHLTTHDPTTLNQQGADKGTQYRSVIFYRNADEKDISLKVIEEIQSLFDNMIVTEVKGFESFYKAEVYHQDYYNLNPDKAYCRAVINPKLQKFKSLYQEKIKRTE